jgi:hypothetical protein
VYIRLIQLYLKVVVKTLGRTIISLILTLAFTMPAFLGLSDILSKESKILIELEEETESLEERELQDWRCNLDSGDDNNPDINNLNGRLLAGLGLQSAELISQNQKSSFALGATALYILHCNFKIDSLPNLV